MTSASLRIEKLRSGNEFYEINFLTFLSLQSIYPYPAWTKSDWPLPPVKEPVRPACTTRLYTVGIVLIFFFKFSY
jgi:hypothetical protein